MSLRRPALGLLAWTISVFIPSASAQAPQRFEADAEHPEYVSGRVIVKFKKTASAQRAQAAHGKMGARVVHRFRKFAGLEYVQLAGGASVQEALAAYRANPDVAYAEPDYIVRVDVAPGDPEYSKLWGMQSINAEQAWAITTGSPNVVVGILDTGIDYTHEDLAANIFKNDADCNTNNIDDDGNGFIDDCYGINTLADTSNVMDDHSHGTHVAGTIGGVGDNAIGVAGVNWKVKMYACKFLGKDGSGTMLGALKCFDYFSLMKDRGVNIVATNNSWGNSADTPGMNIFQQSQSLYEAILGQQQRGILTFFAASNKAANNDMPDSGRAATTDLPSLIAVAAIDSAEKLASFSNYGRHSVQFAAPGVAVLSTVPKALEPSGYKSYSGTSMASPHSAGVAALLKAANPALNWIEIKNLMLAGTTPIPGAVNTVVQGKLNAYGALTCNNSVKQARLLPSMNQQAAVIGDVVQLRALHINCAAPNGNVTVTASPSGEVITLLDDGLAPDQVAGDGIYSAQWTVPSGGSHTLAFPNGDDATIHVLKPYAYAKVNAPYRNITGTGLNVFDRGIGFFGELRPPFPVRFGGTSASSVYVMLRGMVGFFSPAYTALSRGGMPLPQQSMQAFVAPFWDFLHDTLFPDPQGVFWEVLGTAPNRELVIEWRNIEHSSAPMTETISFEVVFFEDKDDVLFLYKDVVFGGSSAASDFGGLATIGIQASPKLSTQYSYHSPVLADGDAILWTITNAPPPVPTIASITPSSVPSNTPDFTMSFVGTNFASGSTARLHTRHTAQSLATTFVDSTHLTALIPSRSILTTDTMWVTVNTPGLGESNGKDLDVLLPIGPILNSLSPASASVGSGGFSLIVDGSGFVTGDIVRWNGADRPTTFDSPTRLIAAIPASDLANSGTVPITVFQNGTTSQPLQFSVTDFRIVLPPATSKTIVAGGSAVFDFQIESQHGSFDRMVQFGCTGLPAAAQCVFSTPSLMPTSTASNVQLTIRTTARSSGSVPPFVPPSAPLLFFWVAVLACAAAFAQVARRKPSLRPALALGAIVLIAAVCTACGGGSAASTPNTFVPPPQTGTPAGSSNVTITATSGATVRTANVSLIVQ